MSDEVSEMASQDATSEEKDNDTNIRRRKFVECAQETFEQGKYDFFKGNNRAFSR